MNDIILRVEEDNKFVVDILHDEYLDKMNEIKKHVDFLGREKLHKSTEELETQVVHLALLLLDKEYLNYRSEMNLSGDQNTIVMRLIENMEEKLK